MIQVAAMQTMATNQSEVVIVKGSLEKVQYMIWRKTYMTEFDICFRRIHIQVRLMALFHQPTAYRPQV